MPELPEVEVIRRGLAPKVVGRCFIGVSLGKHRLRRQSGLREFRHGLIGRRVEAIRRRGKYLLFQVEGGSTLLIHLGMTGRLLLGPLNTDRPAHRHLTFHFDTGLDLHYQDARRFGQVLCFPSGSPPRALRDLGPEPFSRFLTPGRLKDLARGRRKPIKNFLMDGLAVAGIGNIYACEILFAARLSPFLPAGRLSLEQWESLLKESRRILRAAIRCGGTTVSDYLNSLGQAGLFQLDLAVYGRRGEPCLRCGTPVSRLTQAGRSTFFCPSCQET